MFVVEINFLFRVEKLKYYYTLSIYIEVLSWMAVGIFQFAYLLTRVLKDLALDVRYLDGCIRIACRDGEKQKN